MKKNILLAVSAFLITNTVFAQSVTIDPKAGATKIIDAKSTTAGVMVPKMSATQRNAITNPEEGLLVYDTDIKNFYFVQNGVWKNIAGTLDLPFSGTYNHATTSALSLSNFQNATTATAATFEGSYGIGVLGITGSGVAGKFKSVQGGTGIYAETFSGGYAGNFYGGDGTGVMIDRNGSTGNSLVIPRGKVGIGTVTPQTLFQIKGGINEYLWETTAKENENTSDITVGLRINQQYAGFPETAKVMLGTKSDHALNLFTNDNTDSPDMTIYDGKVTIGPQISDSRLTVTRGTYGTAKLLGTNFYTSFMEGVNEDTYIAGGLFASKLYLNAANGQTGSIHIGSATNAITIGSLEEPLSKLTIHTPENSLGLTHTDGTVRMGTFLGVKPNVRESAGWLGTESDHPLHLYTNAGEPQLTVKTDGKVGVGTVTPTEKLHVNGNMKADSGIYSNQVEGLNIVPLGIIHYVLQANDTGSGSASFTQYSTANVVGNLYDNTNSAGVELSTDDRIYGTLNLNAAPLQGYGSVFITATYNISQGNGSHSSLYEIKHILIRSNGTTPDQININYELDNLTMFEATGTIMMYGIKGSPTGPPIFGASISSQK
ncbi:hypothetical protein [Runella sp.]|uniref:hypothetical protein n=1 Tax=Runella sp. TaxID=1960881 RepID=UPI003D13318C